MDILHSKQNIMNPMRDEKFDRFCKILNIPKYSRVIDFGCGKGEFLLRLESIYKISGIGIDKSPYCIEQCKMRKAERSPESSIEYLLMDGKNYISNETFDLTSCIGASWIWGGIQNTLKQLKNMTKKGGLIVLGEPYWIKEPSAEYLKLEDIKRDTFHTHYENVIMGDEIGLECVYTLASDLEDWDSYETPHWWAVSEYADKHPNDPELEEIWENMIRLKDTYLKYGRSTLGWCLYVYRKPIQNNSWNKKLNYNL